MSDFKVEPFFAEQPFDSATSPQYNGTTFFPMIHRPVYKEVNKYNNIIRINYRINHEHRNNYLFTKCGYLESRGEIPPAGRITNDVQPLVNGKRNLYWGVLDRME